MQESPFVSVYISEGPQINAQGEINMDDDSIVALYFARSEQAIQETDAKYSGYCYSIAYNRVYQNRCVPGCSRRNVEG